MKLGTRTAVAVVLFAVAGTASAADMLPARIGEHDTSLANTIKFPDVDGDFTLYLRCEAKVLPAGSINELGCYSDEKIDLPFYRAVNLAAENATVTPASVDGENVGVLMLFSVIFRQQGDERVIAVVPNHGTNARSIGLSYVAPQRYGRTSMYTPRTELGLLWIDAEMTASGKARDIKYLDTEWTNTETKRYARSYIKDGMFIPGFLDGEATTMRFVKPIFGHRNGFMWLKDDSKCGNSTLSCDERSSRTGKPRYVFDD